MDTLHSIANSPWFGIVLGGIGRDLVGRWLAKPQELQQNYRVEIDSLRAEIHALKDEVTRWRGQYYVLLDAVVRDDRERVKELLDQYIAGEKI